MEVTMTLRVGIVGAGEITRKAHLPVLASLPGAQVAWIADQRFERAQAMAAAHGLRAVPAPEPAALPACDIALLAIPVDVRMPYYEHFAARSTAVFAEKPFAMSGAEHERITSMFAPHALGCGYMRRHFRWAVLMRELVRREALGPLRGIEIGEGNRSKGSGTDASFLDDPRLGASRGVLADLGSHGIDLALHLCGANGFAVESCERIMDGNVDRRVTAQLSLFGKSTSAVTLRFGVSWLDRQINQMRLTFEHAMVWSELGPSGSVFVGQPGEQHIAVNLVDTAAGASTYNQAFFLEWSDFIRGVRERRESLCSARSAALTTRAVESLLLAGVSPP
jgi:predicted dehydrogenase